MSAALYDEAFLKKLKSITDKTNIHLYGTDDSKRLFEIIADDTDDQQIQLPIISLRRSGGYTIKEIGNNSRSKNSLKVISCEDGSSVQLNIIPIELNYQIDIYTRMYYEADSIMRELIFILINSPQLSITIPYNDIQLQHKSNIILSQNVSDNSAIPERLIAGQFTRLTVECQIDDAYLFDTRLKNNIQLGYSDLQIMSPGQYGEWNDNLTVTEPIDLGVLSLKT